MKKMFRTFAIAALLPLTLASCRDGQDKAADDKADPAITGALNDPIMVDPDLNGQNRANAGLTGTDPGAGALPPPDSSPQAVANALAEALRLAGGKIGQPPEPVTAAEKPLAVTAEQFAAGMAGNCARKVSYSMIWAARFPEPFALYPQSRAVEAAGIDGEGCHLRVAQFTTPVRASDVISYYYTRARAAGFGVAHTKRGDALELQGAKGAAAYRLSVFPREDGLTGAYLAVNGNP